MKLKKAIEISESLDYLGRQEGLLCCEPLSENVNLIKPHMEQLSVDRKKIQDKADKDIEKLLEKEVKIEFKPIRKGDVRTETGKLNPPAIVLANLDGIILIDNE